MRQVVTKLDWCNAMYDYMIEQLDGRFRLQFPAHHEILDALVTEMRIPMVRGHEETMLKVLGMRAGMIGSDMTACALTGCPNEDNHEFLREYMDLVWDVQSGTELWLKQQGIVPGQSAN